MAQKKRKSEEIVAKLRRVDVLAPGASVQFSHNTLFLDEIRSSIEFDANADTNIIIRLQWMA